ncbi:MAG TPA: hypothetical protein VEI02_00315 [Planctomycetota bacterium]|nr:hypothetical protein [Planctomycetota bacterium]
MKFRSLGVVAVALVATSAATAQTVYSNGPIVTHPGSGYLGADASALELTSGTFGFTANSAALPAPGFRVADDFTVPCGQTWTINSIKGFGYQTLTSAPATLPPTSTLNGGNYRIWDGPPNQAGSNIIHDFTGSNQFVSSSFTNIFRTSNTPVNGGTRPIFDVVMQGNGITLAAGTYWLDYALSATVSGGPFVPSISANAPIAPVGNAVQFLPTAVAGLAPGYWSILVQGPVQVGIPFEIDYSVTLSNCWDFTISQPLGGFPNPTLLINSGGAPGAVYFNAITLTAGNFPNGYFYGLDIPFTDILAEASLGPPFFGVLDANGQASLSVVLPPGFTVYYVGLEIDPVTLTVKNVSGPKTYTTI